jgi:hypothetical protein
VIEELPGHIGNVAFATAPGSSATSDGLFNLAGSFGGTASHVFALGAGNSALNIGSDNDLAAQGVLNNATNLFGDDNAVESANLPGTGLLGPLTPGLNVGFNILGNNNVVLAGAAVPPELGAGNGPLAIAGAILVDNQNGIDNPIVHNSNFGVTLRTPFNATSAPMSVLASGNKVTPKTLAAGSVKNTGSQSSGPLTKAGTQVSSSLKSLSTKVSDKVKKVTGGRAGGTSSD